eukprot:4147036-Pyramimonas_sp.AAC.1
MWCLLFCLHLLLLLPCSLSAGRARGAVALASPFGWGGRPPIRGQAPSPRGALGRVGRRGLRALFFLKGSLTKGGERPDPRRRHPALRLAHFSLGGGEPGRRGGPRTGRARRGRAAGVRPVAAAAEAKKKDWGYSLSR